MKSKVYIAAVTGLLMAVSGTAHAAGNAANGKILSAQCTICHGEDGKGGGPNPPIVALDAARFTAALNDFKSGKRKYPIMEMMAKKLSDQDIADLASHFDTLKK